MNPAGTAVITGASRGIGLSLAAALAREGWDLAIGCRDIPRTRAALESALGRAPRDGAVRFLPLDLASFDSVRAFAASLSASLSVGSEADGRPLDLLVSNAGIAHGHGALSIDGFELVMQTDFLAPFLLSRLVEPLMRDSSRPGMVFTVSAFQSASGWGPVFRRLRPGRGVAGRREDPSRANVSLPRAVPSGRGVLGGALAYAAAKFALSAFASECAARGRDRGLRCAAVHPGVVDTGIMYSGDWSDGIVRAIVRPWLEDAPTGAARLMRAVSFVSGEGRNMSGPTVPAVGNFAYFNGDARADLPAAARDRSRAAELWDIATRLTEARGAASAH